MSLSLRLLYPGWRRRLLSKFEDARSELAVRNFRRFNGEERFHFQDDGMKEEEEARGAVSLVDSRPLGGSGTGRFG